MHQKTELPMTQFLRLDITAHGRDCNNVDVATVAGDSYDLTRATHGYVPLGMCIGGGDDVELSIDIETGTIIGWDAEKVKARIQELINGEAE